MSITRRRPAATAQPVAADDAVGRTRLASAAGLAVAVFLGVVIDPNQPISGLDPGWRAGLTLAGPYGLHFGSDLIFTYGPWGYLDHPYALSRHEFALGIGFAVAATAWLWTVLHRACRWRLDPVPASVVATIVTVCCAVNSEPSQRCLLAAAGHTIWWASTRGAARWRTFDLTPPALAVVAAVMVQVKIPDGVGILVIAVLGGCLVAPLVRALANAVATGVAFVVAFIGFWLAAGQSLGDVGSWMHGVEQITVGYPEAMSWERNDWLLGYLAAFAVAVAAVVVVARGWSSRTRVDAAAVLLVTLVLLELELKGGFSRHDPYHEMTFFACGAALTLSLVVLGRRPTLAFVATGLSVLMLWPGLASLDPGLARDRWRTSAQAVFDPGYAPALRAQAAAGAAAGYGIPSSMLETIGTSPVAVDPWDVGLPYAYGLTWHPVPVFQTYSAYTPYLDGLNARAARQAPADQFVLRFLNQAVDERNPAWDTPEYLLALACDYDPVATVDHGAGGSWELLEHGADRCGAPASSTAPVAVVPGQDVPVPQAGKHELVVASFDPAPPGLLTRVAQALFKPWHHLFIQADGQPYQVPRGLAGGPLLMNMPSSGHRGTVVPAFHYSHLVFDQAGTVTFSTIPVSPSP
jgi:hypothetical protein